ALTGASSFSSISPSSSGERGFSLIHFKHASSPLLTVTVGSSLQRSQIRTRSCAHPRSILFFFNQLFHSCRGASAFQARLSFSPAGWAHSTCSLQAGRSQAARGATDLRHG